MAIDITCPQCKSQYKVRDDLAGHTAKCKKCGTAIEIRHASADAYDEFLSDDDDTSAPGLAAPAAEHAAVDPKGKELCPMCSAELLPGSDMCLRCGFQLEGEPDGAQKSPADRDEYVEQLLAKEPESTASRVSRWAIGFGAVLACLAAMALGGWWLTGSIARSRAGGRIEAVVQSVISGEAAPTEAAAKLAEDVTFLPSFVASLSEQADRIKGSNLNIGELHYIADGPYRQFHIDYSGKILGPAVELFKDIPRPWQQATVLSTLIVNLPPDCDAEPLIQMHDSVAAPAAKIWLAARADLDWQIAKSCDADEGVRAFAADLLLDRLGARIDKTSAGQLLAERTTPDAKRKTFDQLQQQAGPP